MPKNQFQRTVFALITVIITVHCYVFYSLYVVNGQSIMNAAGENSVIAAIISQGGVYTLGHFLPIWAVVITEFIFAFAMEVFVGSPCSFRLASKVFDPGKTDPVIFESAIICATVGIMCPAMSFIAAWLYYPYYGEFNIISLLAQWLRLVCFNFPFAFFTQMFFIQPLVRTIFKGIFVRNK